MSSAGVGHVSLTYEFFYRNVYEAIDNDANYDIIYLDFSKAFDKVLLDRLLSEVRAHGKFSAGLGHG